MATGSPSRSGPAALLVALILLGGSPVKAAKIEAEEVPTGLPSNVNLYAVCWKPGGSEAIAVGDDRAVTVYRDSSGAFTNVEAPSAPEFLLDVAWKPDSSFAMAVGSDGTACLYNGRSVTAVSTGTTKYLYDVDWWPDGSAALVVGAGGTVLRYAGGAWSALESGVAANLMGVSCRGLDGSALVVGLNSTFLRVDADGTVRKLAFEGDWALHSVAWSPQGTPALITGANGIVATYDGSSVRFVNRDTPNVFLGCSWRPDGTQALICGDTGIILRLRDGRLAFIDPGIRSLIQGIAYRPDGSYALGVGNLAKCVRYPVKAGPFPPGPLDNPFVWGGIVAAAALGIALAALKDWGDRRELRPGAEGPGRKAGGAMRRRR